MGVPPLWSWPVECRKRGPKPSVAAWPRAVAQQRLDGAAARPRVRASLGAM